MILLKLSYRRSVRRSERCCAGEALRRMPSTWCACGMRACAASVSCSCGCDVTRSPPRYLDTMLTLLILHTIGQSMISSSIP